MRSKHRIEKLKTSSWKNGNVFEKLAVISIKKINLFFSFFFNSFMFEIFQQWVKSHAVAHQLNILQPFRLRGDTSWLNNKLFLFGFIQENFCVLNLAANWISILIDEEILRQLSSDKNFGTSCDILGKFSIRWTSDEQLYLIWSKKNTSYPELSIKIE